MTEPMTPERLHRSAETVEKNAVGQLVVLGSSALAATLRAAAGEIERLQAEVRKITGVCDELRAADRDHLAAKLGMEKRLTAEIEQLKARHD